MDSSHPRLRRRLLRAFGTLSAPLVPRAASALPRSPRILLIRPDHIGDLLFATPALRGLRTAFPDAHLACMLGPWGKPVLEGNPHLDEIIVCDFPAFGRRPKTSVVAPYRTLLSWAGELRRHRFDLAIVLRFDHWWGALLAHVTGIPRRLGYAVPECEPFLTHALPYVSERHEVQQNWDLVRQASQLGRRPLPERAGTLEFPIRDQDRAVVAAHLAERGVTSDTDLMAIHPGAGAPVKLWRPEAFAQVADVLSSRYQVVPVISGGPGELDLAWSVYGHMRAESIVAAGDTSLGELAALFQRCRLVVGPDCGPLHLAVAVGTPTVHLYGPVDAGKFGPWGDPLKNVVVTSQRECIPCNRLDYRTEELPCHPCVREITPEAVVDAADRLLAAEE